MIFINTTSDTKQAKDYFTASLARPDYYLKDAPEIAGQWHGLGADLLGLSGTVDRDRYFALCDNINPETGKQLTPHNKGNRRIAYDFTFDVPKDVSLAYEVGGDERIMGAFRDSVRDTMSEMEGAMMTRVRTNKRNEYRNTSNMVWAEFIHRTTRPVDGVPDPQLHCHAVAFNCTYDPEEEKFKAGEFSNLVRDKGYYQAAFHSRLAERLAGLGYGIERDGNSFRLVGIAPATTDKFSRRTNIIEAVAERLGITNAKVKGELGRRTREGKDENGLSVSQLRQVWSDRLTDDERSAIINAREGQAGNSPDAKQAMDYALLHCYERASAVPEKELLKTALIHSVGNASVEDVRRQLSRDNILRRAKAGVVYATTKEVLAEEIAMSDFVREGRGKFTKLGGFSPAVLDGALGKEHQQAGAVILNSRDRVTALKGGAGTGKTTLIKAVGKSINKAGSEVFTFAPSAEARDVLRADGFENAETVERFLVDPEMQAKAKGQVLWVDEAGLMSVKDMKRFFDVAEQQNARVVLSGDTAQHQGVNRGDALRILERDAGIKTARLKEIRRQTDETYRAAVKAISEGDTLGKDGRTRLEAGMEILDNMGAIVELPGETRYSQIAMDYAATTAERKADGKFKKVLVVSPTHKEAEHITAAIREELKADGRIGKSERQFLSLRPLNLTEAQRGDEREYRPGTVVQFVQNAKGFSRGERIIVDKTAENGVRAHRADGSPVMVPLKDAARFQVFEQRQVALAQGDRLRITQNGLVARETRRGLLGNKAKDRLTNGALYEVEGFTKKGDIRLSNGFVVPKNYGGVTNGFVVTSHASQGKTVDVSLVAMGAESLAAANREQIYVSISRGREAVRLYTDDKAAMMDAVRHSSARLSASELMQEKPNPIKRRVGVMQRLFKVQQIQRAYKAVRERVAASRQIHIPREVPHHVGVER